MELYNMTKHLPLIKCDLVCPTCGEPIEHRSFEIKDNPHIIGDYWDLYDCVPCKVRWMPKYLIDFNNRPKELQERISWLKKTYKQMTDPQITIEEILIELGEYGESMQ